MLYILPLLLIACGESNNQDKDNSTVDSSEFITKMTKQSTDSINLIDKEIDLDSLRSLEIFKDFAINKIRYLKDEEIDQILNSINLKDEDKFKFIEGSGYKIK